MPLFIGKVGDGDDGSSRLALRCLQHRSDVEWNAFAPGRERWRGEQAVEFHGKCGAIRGREERVDLDDAELSHWRLLDLGEEPSEIEVLAR